MEIGISVNVTHILGNRKQEILAIAEKQVSELKKIKGEKLTSQEELQARHVELKKVKEKTVELAKKVPCNILLSIKEALQKCGYKPSEEKIQNFHASKTGEITAHLRISLSVSETEKAYQNGLLTGYKKKDYEARYKKITSTITLIDPENNIWKLSKEQVAQIRKNTKNTAKTKEKRLREYPSQRLRRIQISGKL